MKHLNDVETEQFVLEVFECNCGFHMGLDATYIDQVDDIILNCPACHAVICTKKLIPDYCPKHGSLVKKAYFSEPIGKIVYDYDGEKS